MAYGQLGPTHHSIEDIAWTRILPNLTVIVPADDIETAAVMRYSLHHQGPMFLRISRIPVPRVHADDYEFRLGKAVRLREGSDVTIITNGVLVNRALNAARLLEDEGISVRVLNMSTIKPLDEDAIVDAARTTKGIVTAEEGLAAGGLGGAVAEVLALRHPAPMRILGLQDVFAPTGSAEFLLEYFKLTADGMRQAALELLSERA
jgi:transketolase